MFKWFKKDQAKSRLIYTKTHIQNDIKAYGEILYKIFAREPMDISVADALKKTITALNSHIFIIVNEIDRIEFKQKTEWDDYMFWTRWVDITAEKWVKDKLFAINNIEDYVIELLAVLDKNAILFGTSLDRIIMGIQFAYFHYLKFKRAQLNEQWENVQIAYKYFDILYHRPFLFDFVNLDETNIRFDDIHRIHKQSEDLKRDPKTERENFLRNIIQDESKEVSGENRGFVKLSYLSALLYFKDRHFGYLNNLLSKDYPEGKYSASLDNQIKNRMYNIAELKQEQVQFINHDWSKEERIVSKSLFFISFDTIIRRFRGEYPLFEALTRVYKSPSIVYYFKVLKSGDFVTVAKNLENFNSFYSSLNEQQDVVVEDDTMIGKWQAKRIFDEALLYSIEHKVSDIYMKVATINGEEKGIIEVRNKWWDIVPIKEMPVKQFWEMINVVAEETGINRSKDPTIPKNGRKNYPLVDLSTRKEYSDPLRLEYNNGNIYIRRLDRDAKTRSIDELWYMDQDIRTVYKWLETNSNGLILTCGPTGSGKTTLMISLIIEYLKTRPHIHLLTAEDPIEKKIPLLNVEQYEVSDDLTFNVLLESFMRSDPDMIMLGEIRSHDVLSTMIDASQTWHLSLSTLHTNSTKDSLDRIIKLLTGGNLQMYEYAKSIILPLVRGIVNVKLLRKICPYCRKPVDPIDVMSMLIKKWFTQETVNNYMKLWGEFYEKRPGGCDKCEKSGSSTELQGIMELMDLCDEENYQKALQNDFSFIKPLFSKWFHYAREWQISIHELLKNT